MLTGCNSKHEIFVSLRPTNMNEESFSKWVILSIFPVIFCSKKRKDKRQTDRKLHRCCSDRITVFLCFVWQNPSSQLLLRWKLNSQRSTKTKVIQATQETQSGKSSLLGSWVLKRWLWGGLNNFNLSSFWLLSGHKISDPKFRQSLDRFFADF